MESAALVLADQPSLEVEYFKKFVYFLQVEILCSDMELGTDFTLHYIKETIAAVEVPALLFL